MYSFYNIATEVYMKTEVVMERSLFGCVVHQKSKSEFFSATDLVSAGNKWRIQRDMPIFNMNEWLRRKDVQGFISELEKVKGVVKINSKGKNSHTWVHPILFIDMALAINPALKVEVYDWLYDQLLKHRNNSGDSFKAMCGALYANESNKATFAGKISRLSKRIQLIVGVADWQKATQAQLELRDKIHAGIALLANVLRDNSQAIDYGIKEATKDKLIGTNA